jgi:hypothetical protein
VADLVQPRTGHGCRFDLRRLGFADGLVKDAGDGRLVAPLKLQQQREERRRPHRVAAPRRQRLVAGLLVLGDRRGGADDRGHRRPQDRPHRKRPDHHRRGQCRRGHAPQRPGDRTGRDPAGIGLETLGQQTHDALCPRSKPARQILLEIPGRRAQRRLP